jgi:EpsI family protein
MVLVAGALLSTLGVKAQRSLPLQADLAATVPDSLEGFVGRDDTLETEVAQVAGVDSYLMRHFISPDTTRLGFSLYVGYYERQTQGATIHSPRNCLPGGGWEPLTNTTTVVATPQGPVRVNQYLLQKGRQQALVLYWYQGRGRVESNEYVVKFDLLRDAALRRRSEEALVRIVVPVTSGEADALGLATRIASVMVPTLQHALPS